MLQKFKQLIIEKPLLVSMFFLILFLSFVPGMFQIQINNDLKATIPKTSLVKITMDKLEEAFGAAETLIVSVKTPDGSSIYNQDVLGRLRSVSDALERVQGISSFRTLATVDFVDKDEEGSMTIHPLIEYAPESEEEVQKIQRDAEKDPLLSRALVSPDRSSFALYIDPAKGVDDAEIIAKILEVVEEDFGGYEISLGGLPYLRDETTKAIQKDQTTLVPMVFVVLTLVLFWALRSVHGVLITLLLVGFSILPSTGLMGYMGMYMSAGNNMFPILILGTACADSIHVLAMFYLTLRQGKTKKEAVQRILDELWLPVFLTSVTTAVGFLTLMTGEIPPIKELGLLVAIGVGCAWVLSTMALPAVLLLVPTPKKLTEVEHALEAKLIPLFHAIASRFAVPTAIAAIVGIVGLSVYFIPGIKLEPRFEMSFPVGHDVRDFGDRIDARFGGTNPIEYVIYEDPRDPKFLKATYAFENEIAATMPQVGSTESPAQMVARVHESLRDDNPEYRTIADDPIQNSQMVFMASIQGNPDTFAQYTKTDYSAYRITIRMKSMPVDEMTKTLEQIDQLFKKHFPAETKYDTTGKVLFDIEQAVMTRAGAGVSIGIAVVLVFFLCWIFIRSFLDGILGMIPILGSIATNFIVMGIFDIGLSISTSIVSSIVIGVGVDYAIHFLTRWKYEERAIAGSDLTRDEKFDKILHLTLEESGPPILFNALAVALGLGVLFFSGFSPISNLGRLAIVSMASTSLASLVLLPVFKQFTYRG